LKKRKRFQKLIKKGTFQMKIITINLVDFYVDYIKKLIGSNDFDAIGLERITQIIKKVFLDWQFYKIDSRKYSLKLYRFCIFCGRRLENPKVPYKHRKFNITELRPCCSCLKEFNSKSLSDLPNQLRKRIEIEVKLYLKMINKVKIEKLADLNIY
jgi:hypothetical protein